MDSPFIYYNPSPAAAAQIAHTASSAEKLLSTINQLPDSREKSLAMTKLEECVMWANKCAARNIK